MPVTTSQFGVRPDVQFMNDANDNDHAIELFAQPIDCTWPRIIIHWYDSHIAVPDESDGIFGLIVLQPCNEFAVTARPHDGQALELLASDRLGLAHVLLSYPALRRQGDVLMRDFVWLDNAPGDYAVFIGVFDADLT